MTGVRGAARAALSAFSCFWFLGVFPAAAHGPLDEQILALTNQIQQDSQNALLYLKRGELHGHHGDWEAALSDYERAAELDPTLVAVDLARGKTLLQAGHFEQAKVALDRFLTRHPDYGEVLATRARVLVKLGQNRAAVNDYTRAIAESRRLGRDIPEYYLERARASAAEGDANIDEALCGLDEGLKALGPIVTLQLEAIDLELTAKRYDAALARVETIAAQSARKEAWLARRGDILEQAGRVEEARAAYEQALAAMESLPARHRKTRATTKLEAQIRAALVRLGGVADKEADL